MLEDHEWLPISAKLGDTISKIKAYRKAHSCDLKTAREAVFEDALALFYAITGETLAAGDCLYHHRLSYFGPECYGCGHLLRTPKARYCANCGLAKNS